MAGRGTVAYRRVGILFALLFATALPSHALAQARAKKKKDDDGGIEQRGGWTTVRGKLAGSSARAVAIDTGDGAPVTVPIGSSTNVSITGAGSVDLLSKGTIAHVRGRIKGNDPQILEVLEITLYPFGLPRDPSTTGSGVANRENIGVHFYGQILSLEPLVARADTRSRGSISYTVGGKAGRVLGSYPLAGRTFQLEPPEGKLEEVTVDLIGAQQMVGDGADVEATIGEQSEFARSVRIRRQGILGPSDFSGRPSNDRPATSAKKVKGAP